MSADSAGVASIEATGDTLDVESTYPLAPMQFGLVLESTVGGRPGANVEQVVCRFTDEHVDTAALERAWQATQAHHEALRTSFDLEHSDGPVQHVHAANTVVITELDWTELDAPVQERALSEWLARDRACGVDLSDPCAIRVSVMELDRCRAVMVWTFHHAILDGRSVAFVLEEVLERYDELTTSGSMFPRAERPRFRDHVHAVTGPDDGAARAFFSDLLAGHPGTPGAPGATRVGHVGDDPSPHREFERRLSRELLHRLDDRAGAVGATVGSALLAAWAVLEARYSASTDVVVGTTRAGRHAVAGAEDMVGCLINTVPIRVRPLPGTTVDELLHSVRAFQLDVRPHEHAALVDVRSWSEVAGDQPLLTSTVVVERELLDTRIRRRGGQPGRHISVHEESVTPLLLTAHLDDGLLLRLEWDTALYEADTVQTMLDHLARLITSFADSDPATLVGDLEMLSEDERRRLLVDRNPPRPVAGTIVERYVDRFEKVAIVHRGDIAVQTLDERERLTYGELDERANRLAHLLVAAGASQEQPVAVCLTRSVDFVVSVLAVLKAGAAYLPLDPSYPSASLAHMLEQSGARLVLASSATAAEVPASDEDVRELLVVDRLAAELAAAPAVAPPRPSDTADQLAYVIYTSGTTGAPKGVMVADRSLVAFCDAVAARYELTAADRVLQFSSLSFDVSIEEMLPTLSVGATVVLRSDDLSSSMGALVDATGRSGLSVLNLPSAMWHALVEHLDATGTRLAPSVRLVVVGGEKVAHGAYEVWARLHPDLRWLNGYGPTETTVTCTSFDPAGRYRVGSGDDLPIGRPMANARAYVLDETGTTLVPDGQIGELWIGGSGVAVGYLGEPELTAERFRPDPFVDDPSARMYRTGDRARWQPRGDLEFLGRTDRQIKLRGFRIEPGEVERALEQHPDVRQAFVSLRRDDHADRLIAWVVPNAGTEVDTADVLASMRHRLPAHAVPAALVVTTALPRTPAGKIDVDELPAPTAPGAARSEGSTDVGAPVNENEVVLCRMFGELLGASRPVGALESFFDLGGHSLLAVRLITRIESELGVRVSLSALYGAPTPRALASGLEHDDGSDLVYLSVIQPSGTLPPLYGIHVLGSNGEYFRPLAAHLGEDQPVFGLSVGDPNEHTPTAIEEIAARYVEEIERHRPDGPLSLAAVSLGGYVAFEVAQQLVARGRDVIVLALFDSAGPGGRPSVSTTERVRIHLGKLRARRGAYLSETVGALWSRVRSVADRLRIRVHRSLGHSMPDELWMHRFVLANTAAAEAYVARPYPRPITVFHATGEVFDSPVAIRTALGWASVAAGPIEVVEVPGQHMSMLEEPYVATLATALRAAMRRAPS